MHKRIFAFFTNLWESPQIVISYSLRKKNQRMTGAVNSEQ